jgi:hypothetical protein
MTIKDLIKYKDDDDFAYLVIEASNDQFYGFNPKNKEENNQAKNIVRDSDWYVVGWKVSRELPSWVKKANYWTDKIFEKNIIEEHANGKYNDPNNDYENDCNDDDNYYIDDGDELVDDNVNDDSKDDNDDEEDDNFDDDNDDDDNDDDEDKTSVEDYTAKDGNENTVVKNPYDKRNNCKGNLKDDSTYGNSAVNFNSNGNIDMCEESIEKEVTMFNNIGDIKHKVAQNIKNATKAKTLQVYVTGPIRNNRTGKTHWVVVFGDSGLAWVLKGPFLTGYIEYLLSQVEI